MAQSWQWPQESLKIWIKRARLVGAEERDLPKAAHPE